jgi:hypothetical protein
VKTPTRVYRVPFIMPWVDLFPDLLGELIYLEAMLVPEVSAGND